MAKAATITQDEDELELIKGADQSDPPKDDDEEEDENPAEPKPADDTAEIETPAEPASEEVGEPADTTSGGGSDDVVAVPESIQPPTDDAKPPTQSVKPQPSANAQRLDQIEKLILAEDFDAYSVDGRRLQLEHNRLAGQVAAEPLVVNQFWTTESVTHNLPQNDLKSIWQGITAQYEKDYPDTHPDYWQIAARKDYNAAVAAKKIIQRKTDPKPAPKVAAAPTPITPKGARIAPPSAVVPPPPKRMSDEEELVDSVRREQKAGVRVW